MIKPSVVELWSYLMLTALTACSFSQSDHPAACTSPADCKKGYECYEQFCVPGGSHNAGSGGSGASGVSGGTSGVGAGASAAGTSAGTGASGVSGGTNSAGSGGSAGTDADASQADASMPTPDASMNDAAMDSGPTVPGGLYAPCTTNLDCAGPLPTCTKNPLGGATATGFCTQSCSDQAPCPAPSSGTAVAACTDDDTLRQCVLLCALGATCPTGLSCTGVMLCY